MIADLLDEEMNGVFRGNADAGFYVARATATDADVCPRDGLDVLQIRGLDGFVGEMYLWTDHLASDVVASHPCKVGLERQKDFGGEWKRGDKGLPCLPNNALFHYFMDFLNSRVDVSLCWPVNLER